MNGIINQFNLILVLNARLVSLRRHPVILVVTSPFNTVGKMAETYYYSYDLSYSSLYDAMLLRILDDEFRIDTFRVNLIQLRNIL